MNRMRSIATALLPALLAACEGDGISPEGDARVTVAFAASTPAAASLAPSASRAGAQQELVIRGSNGTLTITDLVLIVSEFELKRDERIDECDASGPGNPCRRFEAPPFLLDLPLTASGVIEVVNDLVPLGTYEEVEFEVEDLDEDSDDDLEVRQGIAAIRQEIAAAFPGVAVPREASLFVRGRFTPAVGADRPFLTLFDAEIEVEVDLDPPLVITDEGATRMVVIELDPGQLFRRGAEVLDLSALDFVRTGEVPELEAEFEAAFEAEVDD